MAGCGGNCQCRNQENKREIGSLAEAVAKVVVDRRTIVRTVELYELGVVRVEDLLDQITAEKIQGLL